MEAFMKKMSTKYLIRVSISVILLILLDQLTKIWAVVRLKDQPAISLIRGVFELQYLENRGSAFGMMQGARVFFIISTIVLFLLVCVIYIRIPKEKMYLPLRVIAVLFLAGAAGNFIDRVRQGFVVDFFYFSLINFPIFNVADIYVTVSMIVLILLCAFYYHDHEIDVLFSKSKKD